MGKPISSGKKQRSAVVLNKKAGGLRGAGVQWKGLKDLASGAPPGLFSPSEWLALWSELEQTEPLSSEVAGPTLASTGSFFWSSSSATSWTGPISWDSWVPPSASSPYFHRNEP